MAARSREEELERKAEEIADEAVAGYEKILEPDVIAEIRRVLIFDMLCTEAGRAELRACLEDPIVEESDELANEPMAKPSEKKRGAGER
ncbi:MAG: hypothetical protein U0414_21905 [Polyangiaceae bacterium]